MDDLISEFIVETSESLSVLDLELVKFEQNPEDEQILGNIFRLVHTIKGTCGFLGLPRLESVAHAGENVLGKIRDKELAATPEAISLVLEALDAIRALIEHLSENASEPEGNDTDLITRLNHFAETGGSAAGGAAESEAPADMTELAADVIAEMMGDAPPAEEGADTPAEPAAQSEEAEEPPVAAEPEASIPVAPEEKPAASLSKATKKQAVEKGLKTEGGKGGSLANQTIRVNLDVLENLMSMVGELVLTRNQLLQVVRTKDDNDFKTPMQRLNHITSELQEGVMQTRMQPIGNAWAKFPRLIRDLSNDLSKKIELRMIGAETELDRQLLELIKDPLTHMVRNSCDHGLEDTPERVAAGKPETGTVTLSAYHEGGHIIIEVSDDGKGVNIERVRQKALESGVTTEEEVTQMSDQQIAQFIFKAGFSTAAEVTSVSGRGVGMDVVRTNIEKIGGTVELESVTGKGSTFHIKIPLTLAIVSVLLVEASGQKFAIPQINVLELVKTGQESGYKIETINEAPVLRLRDKLLPLISLSRVLGKPASETSSYIVVCKVGPTDYGLLVDTIFDTEEIVVKPVSESLKQIPLYSGNTVLGDGSVIMILDPNGVAKTVAGELEVSREDGDEKKSALAGGGKMVPFLLFASGSGGPKAVPLELVSRLEELDVAQIEYSDARPVVQYRGDLMVLTKVGDQAIPESGSCEVIVFNYDNRTVGLVVDEIRDIVKAEAEVKLVTDDKAFMGTIVMAEKSTDVIDVGQLLSRVLDIKADLGIDFGDKPQDSSLLFVEDSMFFRNLTVPFLSAVGYRVTAVPDGGEALRQLQKRKFDIIVTDIEMPVMDGFELARAIRALPDYAEVPVIAFTATSNESFQDQIDECGIDDYVLKTEREKLLLAIARQLSSEEEEALV